MASRFTIKALTNESPPFEASFLLFITFRSPFESVPEEQITFILCKGGGGSSPLADRRGGDKVAILCDPPLLPPPLVRFIRNIRPKYPTNYPSWISLSEPGVQIELVRLEKRNRKYLLTSFQWTHGGREGGGGGNVAKERVEVITSGTR